VIPVEDVRLIAYPGEIGVALQHLGILAGHEAYARMWPGIVAWLKSRG
jgi:poly[(R)-3-hydroxyalkanoate] polymerase subunit PhaC